MILRPNPAIISLRGFGLNMSRPAFGLLPRRLYLRRQDIVTAHFSIALPQQKLPPYYCQNRFGRCDWYHLVCDYTTEFNPMKMNRPA